MTDFAFRPSARLQQFLGRELIADPNLAVIEFVKNAYDASAKNVFVVFQLADAVPTRLIIADDGTGMDEASFERNWMHPGYSEKAQQQAGSTSGRVPVGEKGLGRLAAGRLGDELEVFTRKRARDPWLHVHFDWSSFDDMTKMMDEVRIPYDYETRPDEQLVDKGTIVVITDLQQGWDERVRGRPVAGRSRTRLGRLKQDLELLLRPLAPTDPGFEVHLDSDSVIEDGDVGTITPQQATDEADYVYDFEFRVNSRGKVTVHRQLQRSVRVAEELGGQTRDRYAAVGLNDIAAQERRPETLECGPFRGRFIYTPPPAAKRAKEVDAVGHGVLLYRDAVMVEPYGLDGDDWLGVSSRKAQRQGYALVQPTTFSGFVLLSRETNPQLRDMSNRQGLIENEASEVFLQHVHAEFLVFESLVFEELSQRWTSAEEKAAQQSEDSLDLVAVRLRAVAHSLGQPLMGLGADIAGVRIVAGRQDVPGSVRAVLLDLADSAERHLEQARLVLGRFRDVPVSDRSAVMLPSLIDRAASEVAALASSLGVRVNVQAIPEVKVFVHEELIIEALKELMRNAIEASHAAESAAVEVASHDSDGDPVVDVIDNGAGIPGGAPDVDLSSIPSTKGRPGEGLAMVDALVVASRGRVRVASTGPDGTHIEVYLPTRIKGLRSRK
jgi:signal transduction histidine kinase